MPWWMWMLLGLGLFAAETITPGGFFVFFFGFGAVVVGALASVGWAGGDQVQWLLFPVVSVATLLMLRPRLAGRFGEARPSRAQPEYIGAIATLVEDLEPGGIAKAELRGTSWTVRSHHGARIARGSRCAVERIDGLTLWVLPPQGER